MIDFVILYPIVWLFERNRPGVDGWGIASCLAIPAILSVFIYFGFAIFDKPQIGQLINTVLFPTVMGICLWQMLGIPGKRAIVYVFAYLAFWVFVGMVLASLGVGNAS